MNKITKKLLFERIFIATLLLLGIFVFFKPIINSQFHFSQSDIGDSVLNNFLLEHSYQVVFNPSYKATAWSPIFFYPQPNVLAYGDNLWGVAPFYWMVRFFCAPETSFQFWMVIMAVLNFFAFYLLARSLKIINWFAGFGSFLFAFCLPRISQLGHQQLLPQFYSVLALLFLFKFFENKKFKYLILFEVCVYFQMLAGIYLGWFFLLAVPVLILLQILYSGDKLIFKAFFNLRVLASICTLFFCLAFTFFPYYTAQNELGKRPYQEIETMTPRIISYLSVDQNSIFYKFYPEKIKTASESLPMRHEHLLFLGIFIFLLLLSSVVGLFYIKKEDAKKYSCPVNFVITFGVFIFITLISIRIPFTEYSFWINIYNFVPGAGAIRALTRIWLVSYLFLFLAVMILASIVYQKTKSKYLKILLLILGLLACLEQVNLNPSYFDKLLQQNIQKQIDQAISYEIQNNKVDAFYLRWSLNDPGLFYDYQLKAMWASLHLNIPTVNGYSGQQPRFYYKSIRFAMFNEEIIRWIRYSNPYLDNQKILVLDSSIVDGNFKVEKAEIIEVKK